MKLKLAASLTAGLFALAACDSTISNSGLSGNSSTEGNFAYDTPEFFINSVGDRVLFIVDQSNLGVEAMSILDAQAQWLMENGSFTALIEGHADEQGTREYNLALGARRASAVQAYLVSQGVATNRLTTVTYGKERPIEICSTEACWSQNRRGVTVVKTNSGV